MKPATRIPQKITGDRPLVGEARNNQPTITQRETVFIHLKSLSDVQRFRISIVKKEGWRVCGIAKDVEGQPTPLIME